MYSSSERVGRVKDIRVLRPILQLAIYFVKIIAWRYAILSHTILIQLPKLRIGNAPVPETLVSTSF